jgi:hypothetical protein
MGMHVKVLAADQRKTHALTLRAMAEDDGALAPELSTMHHVVLGRQSLHGDERSSH